MMQPNLSINTTVIPSRISMNSTESTLKMNKNVLPLSSSVNKNVLFQSTPISVQPLERFRARSTSREDNQVIKKYVWTYMRYYERTGVLKDEVWRRKATTNGGETNSSEEAEQDINKPILSYQKFYYPDGTTLYSEKWTYNGYSPFPFGFPPFAAEETKEKGIGEKLKDESFSGIVQNGASEAFMFVLKSVVNFFKKK